jgi:aryl-alcohol dehydrogenase-like predicted oxidoreductase
MKKRLIPGTELKSSVLCLGTGEYGSELSEANSEALLNCYLEGGGNFLDTAEVYAEWIPGGSHRSEEFLGKWLRRRKKRDDLILSTKGAHPRISSKHIPRMSRQEVESDLNSSLERLGVDFVDIYWLHRDDVNKPVEDILMMLDDFRKAGKFKYAGFSNWTQTRAEAARIAAAKLNVQGFIASQNHWSLAEADASKGDPTIAYIDSSFIEWHVKHGVAAFAYTSQGKGYFRRLGRGNIAQAPEAVRAVYHHRTNERRFERVKALQSETGHSVGQIVLGYLLGHPFAVFPMIGPKKVEDLQESLRAANVELTLKQVQFLTAND